MLYRTGLRSRAVARTIPGRPTAYPVRPIRSGAGGSAMEADVNVTEALRPLLRCFEAYLAVKTAPRDRTHSSLFDDFNIHFFERNKRDLVASCVDNVVNRPKRSNSALKLLPSVNSLPKP